VISVTSFPSLDNNGDELYLRSPQNSIIHAIDYTIDWYKNELKKDGGWTLEMIDTKNPCGGADNWAASVNVRGGTPGKINTVAALNPDQRSPALINAYAIDSANIVLVFDEPLDSLRAVINTNYNISDGIAVPQSVVAVSPIFDKLILKLTVPLSRNKIYTVAANGVSDCAGNIIGAANTTKVALSTVADSMDVVINEILFNPKPGGSDYVEIYNRSKKVVDARELYVANRNSASVIAGIKQVSAVNRLLFPGDFLVMTEAPQQVQQQYFSPHPETFIAVSGMPSFNDDKGDVILLNVQGSVIDELKYDEQWHFKLIDNHEGVSLERIDVNGVTQEQGNWHSAATNVRYGTPGYKNSQYRADAATTGTITVFPEIVSPDNDGIDDVATIDYSFPSPGYVAGISIFDAMGRPVRYLQRNALCGISGNFRWDGLGEHDQQLPAGIYIIYTEVYNLQGKRQRFKNVIVLARRF
jgi:hypothetical protein